MASTRAILLAVASTMALLASIASLTTAQTLHTHMSPDELRRVFHVEEHEQVPEYEIVHVHSSARRDEPLDIEEAENSEAADSADSVDSAEQSDDSGSKSVPTKHLKLSAFGQDLKLKMKKATGLFKGDKVKMWSVQKNVTEPHQVEYTEESQDDDEDIGEIYQDEENLAALLLQTEKDGTLAVEGTIGHELVVKPIPHSLRRHLSSDAGAATNADDEMFLDQDGEDVAEDVSIDTGKPLMRSKRAAGAVRAQQHIVYKRSVRPGQDDLSDYAFMEVDHMSKKHRTKRSISKREAPYVIYPEILVIVDYDGYRLHGGDNVQIKRYFVSFWNGVDLRYKLLKGPKIRISIAGIIISRGRDATPYLERNRVGRDAIDSAAALTDMGKYLFRERRLPVYDIAVAVTKLDMCRRQYANDACNRGTAGFAYVGGACVVNKRLEKVNSVAIIEDTGGFSGIIVGAHEVGHLLGAVHDGSPPPSYLGGPGAEKCRWEDGFIMSDLRHTDKGFKWSSCSVTSFHHFLNGDTATCLYNSPHEDESLPRMLPGKLLTLDAQCRKDRGTSACFKDDRVCAQLFCFDAGSGYCVAYRPAAEGSSCGDGQYCINGKCTTEHENIIPDYSSNTPTYIRRSDDADTSATQARPSYVALANATTQRYEWNEHKTTQEVTTTTTTTQAPSPQKYSFKVNFYPTTKNPYSYYSKDATTKSPYSYSKDVTTKSPYSYSKETTTKYSYPYNKETTTKSPYSYPYSKETVPTKSPYNNPYSKETTTKSPYNYKNDVYTTTTTTLSPFYEKYKNYNSATTKSPYNFYKISTTKNPYDFSNFHLTHVRNPQPVKTPEAEHKQEAASSTEVRYETLPTSTRTTTENPYSKYYKDQTTTTKKPTYNHYNQYYGSSSTGNPYALSYTKPTPKPYSYNPYAYTTTTKKSPFFKTSATENVETIVPFGNAGMIPAADTECVDTATNIAGSMTCSEFLRSYGYQYCHSRYMVRNCCASHSQLCSTPPS